MKDLRQEESNIAAAVADIKAAEARQQAEKINARIKAEQQAVRASVVRALLVEEKRLQKEYEAARQHYAACDCSSTRHAALCKAHGALNECQIKLRSCPTVDIEAAMKQALDAPATKRWWQFSL